MWFSVWDKQERNYMVRICIKYSRKLEWTWLMRLERLIIVKVMSHEDLLYHFSLSLLLSVSLVCLWCACGGGGCTCVYRCVCRYLKLTWGIFLHFCRLYYWTCSLPIPASLASAGIPGPVSWVMTGGYHVCLGFTSVLGIQSLLLLLMGKHCLQVWYVYLAEDLNLLYML